MRSRAIVAALVAALAVSAAAPAKEPSSATIAGPGLTGAIALAGDGESPGTPLGRLAEAAGFAPAVFGHRDPDPMLSRPPEGDLGPRYEITYVMRGPNGTRRIDQDVYPYATPVPLTYMRPGQSIPAYGWRTYGGWYKAGPALKDALVAAGLPARVPPPNRSLPWRGVLLAAVAAFVLMLPPAALAVFPHLPRLGDAARDHVAHGQ
jgi:hypothetical protein